MTRNVNKTLDRMNRDLDRRLRRAGRRTSIAPIVLGLALVVGYFFLTQLVPRIWAATLPGGLAQANALRGWPGLLRDLAVWIGQAALPFFGMVALVVVVGVILARRYAAFRWVFRLLALAAILVDFAIIALAMRVAYVVAGAAVGIR